MCMHLSLHVKCPIFLLDFNQIWIRLTYFNRIVQHKTSWKSVQKEPSLYMRTGIKKLKGAFPDFANANYNIHIDSILNAITYAATHWRSNDWIQNNMFVQNKDSSPSH